MLILVILALIISLAWKLMSPVKNKKPDQRRFSIRKHRFKRREEDDDE